MTDIALRPPGASSVSTIALAPNRPGTGTMRLVEWAAEAAAANQLAKALARTPFAGSWRGDEDGATAAILKGAEVGLTPVTALGAFDNIQGTPAPKAITLRALVQSHGHDLEITEETDERATARYRRGGRGEWLSTTFTIADAARMNLVGKDNWKKQPGAMLVARVTAKAARLVAADVILGIGYSAEEIRDQDDRAPVAPREAASGTQRMGALLGVKPGPATVSDAPDEPGTTALDPRGALARRMFATFRQANIEDRDDRLTFIADVLGREVKSSAQMTDDDARVVIDALTALPTAGAPAGVDEGTGEIHDGVLIDDVTVEDPPAGWDPAA